MGVWSHSIPMVNDHLLQDSVEKEGDGGEAGEGAESELERSNETMQRLLNIMAKFLEGEVMI